MMTKIIINRRKAVIKAACRGVAFFQTDIKRCLNSLKNLIKLN